MGCRPVLEQSTPYSRQWDSRGRPWRGSFQPLLQSARNPSYACPKSHNHVCRCDGTSTAWRTPPAPNHGPRKREEELVDDLPHHFSPSSQLCHDNKTRRGICTGDQFAGRLDRSSILWGSGATPCPHPVTSSYRANIFLTDPICQSREYYQLAYRCIDHPSPFSLLQQGKATIQPGRQLRNSRTVEKDRGTWRRANYVRTEYFNLCSQCS